LQNASFRIIVLNNMSFTGIVENGKVVLPPEANLPSGTKVRVETVEPETDSLADSLQEFIGVFDDLPADLARNHDHYIHGAGRAMSRFT
jgi:hypothetical protein